MSPKIRMKEARFLYRFFICEKRFWISVQKSFVYSEITKIEKGTKAY